MREQETVKVREVIIERHFETEGDLRRQGHLERYFRRHQETGRERNAIIKQHLVTEET